MAKLSRVQKQALSVQAKMIGRKAFKDGKRAVPVLDQDLSLFIENSRELIGNEIGSSEFIYKAWTDGWTMENVSAGPIYFNKLDELSSVMEEVKEIVQESFDSIAQKYEISGEVEEVECRSRDGFISSNDGGASVRGFTDLGYLFGTGYLSNLPKIAQEKLNELYEISNKSALEEFKRRNEEKLKDIEEDKINYSDLNDLGKSQLAEELSELESEYTSDESSSVMFEIEAFVHRKDNRDEKRSMYVALAVNWEAPYHRKGSSNEWFVSETFEFETREDLISGLKLALKKITSNLV